MKCKTLSFFIILFLFIACEIRHGLTYKISNKTDENIMIVDLKKYQPNDTIVVPPDFDYPLFEYSYYGPKKSVKKLSKSLLSPLDSILIIYPDRTQKVTTISDFDSWYKKGTSVTIIID